MTTAQTIDALETALADERAARQQAEARASSAEAMVAHYKLLIAKLRREQYGQSSERGPQAARPAGIATRGAGSERG